MISWGSASTICSVTFCWYIFSTSGSTQLKPSFPKRLYLPSLSITARCVGRTMRMPARKKPMTPTPSQRTTETTSPDFHGVGIYILVEQSILGVSAVPKKGTIVDLIAPRVALRDVGGDALNEAVSDTLAELARSADFYEKREPRAIYRQDRKGMDLVYRTELYLSRPETAISTLQGRITKYEKRLPDPALQREEWERLDRLLGESRAVLAGFLKDARYESDKEVFLPALRAVSVIPFNPHGPWGASLTVECRRVDSAAYALGKRVSEGMAKRLPELTIFLQEEELDMSLDDVVLYRAERA